jgi:hypothetical protein
MSDAPKGCPECGPYNHPGFVPIRLAPGTPGNPYQDELEVWEHCRACNGIRAAVADAGRLDAREVDRQGWPTDWIGPKHARAGSVAGRGWQQVPEPGPVLPLPEQWTAIKDLVRTWPGAEASPEERAVYVQAANDLADELEGKTGRGGRAGRGGTDG